MANILITMVMPAATKKACLLKPLMIAVTNTAIAKKGGKNIRNHLIINYLQSQLS